MKNYFKPLSIIVLSVFLMVSCVIQQKIDNPEISTDELKSHIKYLASEELAGRYPGTEGDQLSADYIARQFKDLGLKPLTKNYLQPFEVATSVGLGENNFLVYEGDSAVLRKDFIASSIAEDAALKSGICFVGYGFDINTNEIQWNDYEGMDVNGKWVLVLKGEPEIDSLQSPYIRFSKDHFKVMTAKDHGAAGVLFVAGQHFSMRDVLDEPSRKTTTAGIPVIQLSRQFTNKILEESKIEDLEKELNTKRKPLSFALNKTLEAQSDIDIKKAKTYNVIAYIEGTDAALKDEFVVIGGHYDHLGMGGEGSSSRRQDTIAPHYGADDNASGVAALIELAEKFAAQKQNKRSLVFIAFGAEEMGLLGSEYFTEKEIIDSGKISAMINLDMIGRLKADNSLSIGGVGSSKEALEILENNLLAGQFKIGTSNEGYGPSDHASFYKKDIPVFFISTGAHLDYHTPADTYDKINFPGLKTVGDYVYELATAVCNRDAKLTYQDAGPKTGKVSRKRMGVTLGIMPDYAGKTKEGLRADFVTKGKPAYKAGMKDGDVIIAIEGKKIKDIYEYMYRLQSLKFGQTITIEVLRDGEKMVLIVQL